MRNQKDGTWSLSPESQYPLTAPDGARIVHVEFNGIGIDVAAFDDSGRLYLWTLASALGRMQPARVESSNGKIGDLEVAIGVHWLPVYPTQFRVSLTVDFEAFILGPGIDVMNWSILKSHG